MTKFVQLMFIMFIIGFNAKVCPSEPPQRYHTNPATGGVYQYPSVSCDPTIHPIVGDFQPICAYSDCSTESDPDATSAMCVCDDSEWICLFATCSCPDPTEDSFNLNWAGTSPGCTGIDVFLEDNRQVDIRISGNVGCQLSTEQCLCIPDFLEPSVYNPDSTGTWYWQCQNTSSYFLAVNAYDNPIPTDSTTEIPTGTTNPTETNGDPIETSTDELPLNLIIIGMAGIIILALILTIIIIHKRHNRTINNNMF